MIKVIPFTYNVEDDIISNTFILIDSKKRCFVVDPGCDYDGIVNYIKKNDLDLKGILLTHTHFDHMRGINRLLKYKDVPLFVEENDVPGLTNPTYNCSNYFDRSSSIVISKSPNSVSDGDLIKGLEEDVVVLSTPYHTIGSCCYYLKDNRILLSGDTLFKMTIGRSDLPTSSPNYKKSTFEKLLKLPDDVNVYPGHGRNTSIGEERIKNPFIKR